MIRILAFIVLHLISGASIAAATPDNGPIERAVSALTDQFSDGIAYSYSEEPPVIKYGHIFDNDSNDAVAFFSLDGFGGSNHHVEYVAFFAAVPQVEIAGTISRPYRLIAVSKIGQRGWRTFDWKSAVIKPALLTVSGMQMGSKDALCCPSAPIKITFHIDAHDGIVEVKEQASPSIKRNAALKRSPR